MGKVFESISSVLLKSGAPVVFTESEVCVCCFSLHYYVVTFVDVL